jgi:hypothetical protein
MRTAPALAQQNWGRHSIAPSRGLMTGATINAPRCFPFLPYSCGYFGLWKTVRWLLPGLLFIPNKFVRQGSRQCGPFRFRALSSYGRSSGSSASVSIEAASCVDGPRFARVFSRDEQWSLAVMCPAFQCGLYMTAGLDGFRESRPYQLVGIGIPLRRSGFSRSVG